MTTIRQLITSSPVRANELFAKLVDTSETAVKTRDRLFSELKVELDLQAELEEQHLFPVLKKHKDTKGLVADALNDNQQTRKLMDELERTPKDSEAFGAKVAELRKVFQQHVRDDKKEFLPAVIKALSDEEASSVVEKIEDEKARIEADNRADADERRAETKREREQAEAANDKAKTAAERAVKATEATKASVDALGRKGGDDKKDGEAAPLADSRRKAADVQDDAASVVNANAEMAQQGAKAARTVALAGAERAVEMNKAVRATGSAATQAAADETASATMSMAALFSEQTQHAIQTTIAVSRAKTLADVAQAQGDFIGGSLQRMARLNKQCLAFAGGGMATAWGQSSRR